jgi:hypothetical protein
MTRHKTEAINLRMSPEMKAMLRTAADREHRTLSNMIEHLLIDYCERHAIPRPLLTEERPASNRRTSGGAL